jgi:hypothetical protein
MMKAIGDNIVVLSFIALACFFLFGIGWLINSGENHAQAKYNECIAAGMQYIRGSCVR